MTTLNLVWSFDETLCPARGQPARPWLGRALLRALASGPARLGPVLLAGVVFVYLSLSGFTCARWCELLGLDTATPGTAAHAHHAASPEPAVSVALASAAEAPGWFDNCRLQAPHPAGVMAPLVRELPIPLLALALTLVLLGTALRLDPLLVPAPVRLPPPEHPPRRVR